MVFLYSVRPIVEFSAPAYQEPPNVSPVQDASIVVASAAAAGRQLYSGLSKSVEALSLSNREELTKGETPNFPPPTAAALLLKGPPQKIAAAAGAASASSSHWREKDDGWRGRNGWILWLVA